MYVNFIFIYIFIYVYIFIYIYICIYIYYIQDPYIFIHMYTRPVCVRVCMCVCVYIYTYIHMYSIVCVCVCVCVCVLEWWGTWYITRSPLGCMTTTLGRSSSLSANLLMRPVPCAVSNIMPQRTPYKHQRTPREHRVNTMSACVLLRSCGRGCHSDAGALGKGQDRDASSRSAVLSLSKPPPFSPPLSPSLCHPNASNSRQSLSRDTGRGRRFWCVAARMCHGP